MYVFGIEIMNSRYVSYLNHDSNEFQKNSTYINQEIPIYVVLIPLIWDIFAIQTKPWILEYETYYDNIHSKGQKCPRFFAEPHLSLGVVEDLNETHGENVGKP